MMKNKLPYFILLLLTYNACNVSTQKDKTKEQSKVLVNILKEHSIIKDSAISTILDTNIDNFKISFFYKRPFQYSNDNFDFKGILNVQRDAMLIQDTLIFKSTEITEGVQKLMIVNNLQIPRVGSILFKGNFIFISLAYYPGQILYVAKIFNKRIQIISRSLKTL